MEREFGVPRYTGNFREALQRVLDSGRIAKIDITKKTGISRSGIDSYLEPDGTIPNLDTAGRIADAIGIPLNEMIGGPALEPANHPIEECCRRVVSAALEKKERSPGDRLKDFAVEVGGRERLEELTRKIFRFEEPNKGSKG